MHVLGKDWKYISKEAKDMIKKMLIYDYHKRPTAQELLTHEWLKMKTEKIPISNEVLQNLRGFDVGVKLCHCVLDIV